MSPPTESNPSYVFTVTASDRELSESADIFLNLDRLIVFGDIDELTELNGGARILIYSVRRCWCRLKWGLDYKMGHINRIARKWLCILGWWR